MIPHSLQQKGLTLCNATQGLFHSVYMCLGLSSYHQYKYSLEYTHMELLRPPKWAITSILPLCFWIYFFFPSQICFLLLCLNRFYLPLKKISSTVQSPWKSSANCHPSGLGQEHSLLLTSYNSQCIFLGSGHCITDLSVCLSQKTKAFPKEEILEEVYQHLVQAQYM